MIDDGDVFRWKTWKIKNLNLKNQKTSRISFTALWAFKVYDSLSHLTDFRRRFHDDLWTSIEKKLFSKNIFRSEKKLLWWYKSSNESFQSSQRVKFLLNFSLFPLSFLNITDCRGRLSSTQNDKSEEFPRSLNSKIWDHTSPGTGFRCVTTDEKWVTTKIFRYSLNCR